MLREWIIHALGGKTDEEVGLLVNVGQKMEKKAGELGTISAVVCIDHNTINDKDKYLEFLDEVKYGFTRYLIFDEEVLSTDTDGVYKKLSIKIPKKYFNEELMEKDIKEAEEEDKNGRK
mgnify:CR=1 FL=1